ncbi:MAG: hypothetical protein AB7D37_06195 [Desulfovibrio sp.]
MSALNKLCIGLVGLGIASALAFGAGYSLGFERADNARRAEVAALNAQAATWKAEQAQALANAERDARRKLEDAQAKVNALAARLEAARRESAARIKDITRRIPHATAGLRCAFGPDFVRLYNEAIGAATDRAGGGAVSQTANSAAASGASGAAPAADARLRPGRAVTPADILANIRDFGARSQAMEAQLNALIDLTEQGGK